MSDVATYPWEMRTLVLDSSLPEIRALLDRRHRTGADRRDEVWEGVLHVVPATSLSHARIAQQLQLLLEVPAREAGLELLMQPFNLGDSLEDFRVPDGGMFEPGTDGVWIATARLVIEIVSPSDQSREKRPYFASRGVHEVLILEPGRRLVDWFALHEGSYRRIHRSELIQLGPAELASQLVWPDSP